MVRCHTQGLDKELHGFVDAVLVVETQTSNVQSVRVRGIHPQDIAVRKGFVERSAVNIL